MLHEQVTFAMKTVATGKFKSPFEAWSKTAKEKGVRRASLPLPHLLHGPHDTSHPRACADAGVVARSWGRDPAGGSDECHDDGHPRDRRPLQRPHFLTPTCLWTAEGRAAGLQLPDRTESLVEYMMSLQCCIEANSEWCQYRMGKRHGARISGRLHVGPVIK